MAASKWWNYMVFMALVGLAICSANRLPVRGTRAENGDDLDEHKAARALGGMGGGFGGLGRWGYNHRGHYYPGFGGGGGGGGGGPWYGGRGYDYGGGVPYRCVPPSTCPICHDFLVYVNHDNHPPQASAGSKGESGQFNKKATVDQSSAAQATESN